MAKNPVRVLVIAPPGPWRDSLRVLLRASRQVGQIDQVDNGPSGLRLFDQNRPDLILLDASLPADEVAEALRLFKHSAPGSPCLVLAHSSVQERTARTAGAGVILPDGFSTEAFYEALDTVIYEK